MPCAPTARLTGTFRRPVAAVAVALLGALVLGACGSSPKTSAPTTTRGTAAGKAARTTTSGAPTTTGTPFGPQLPVNTLPGLGIVLIPQKDQSPPGTSGTAPKLVVPPGNPPKQLEVADLIGGNGPIVKKGDSVTAQYVLADYATRKVLQSSWTGSGPASFTLATSGLIPGWVDGIPGMRVGGRRELIIPPALGYGASPPSSQIAANDTLVFIVDVLSIGSTAG